MYNVQYLSLFRLVLVFLVVEVVDGLTTMYLECGN